MFTVLHKWDNYNSHSIDQVAKYLYQSGYDTQTTEKLCLLFNMLESNTSNDPNHSRWEADDRWIVHADDVAEIEWPGEKRLKRKHNQITNGEQQQQQHIQEREREREKEKGEEDDKRTKAKRWDTFSKFLARIGFLKSSSKKSMAWVCSWNDTSGIFNRSKLVGAAQNGAQSQSSSSSSSSTALIPTSSTSSSSSAAASPPTVAAHSSSNSSATSPSINSTPASPQIPLSPHTPHSYTPSPSQYTAPPPPSRQQQPQQQQQHQQQQQQTTDYHPTFNYPPSPTHLPSLSSSGNDHGIQMAFQGDIPFTYHSPNSGLNGSLTQLPQYPYPHNTHNSHSQHSQHSTSSLPFNPHILGRSHSPMTNLSTMIERIDSPPHHPPPVSNDSEHDTPNFAPLANSADKIGIAANYPPTFSLSSYMRDIQESPYEYYENRGCVHAVNPMSIMNILKYLRVRVHRNWENFNFTNRARVEANKQLIETVKDCGWEHTLTRVPVIKIAEGGSISSQIRKQFPSGRTWEPEEYKSILLSVLNTPINQHVIVRQRNLKFKSEKISVREVRKETAKAEFRLWSHIEPETQLVFPPALPSITKAYKYKDSYLHVATGLNLDSITNLRYPSILIAFLVSFIFDFRNIRHANAKVREIQDCYDYPHSRVC